VGGTNVKNNKSKTTNNNLGALNEDVIFSK
jgi:hypothetical protein